MLDTTEGLTTEPLGLTEELILMLLNEQSGYFHQIPGWNLNCAVVGAALAELSLLLRIDTDMEFLHLLDRKKTDNPILDRVLGEILKEPKQRNTQYWIERLATQAESIIDMTLARLVRLNILEYHDGDFWTLNPASRCANLYGESNEDTATRFIKMRIQELIFTDAVPGPRDVIIICLVNTCDVFRFIYELDDNAEERIRLICKMDLIGRSIADAVEHNIASPLLRRPSFTKKVPTVSLSRILFSRHARNGNIPALFADLAKTYGPIFEIKPPFNDAMLFLAGPETNLWAHRNGRMHLRSRDYFADIEKVYGASGLIPSLDGADHFQLRKAMQPGYSRKRLVGRLDDLYRYIRRFMMDWKAGSILHAHSVCRLMVNAQVSPLVLSINSQDIVQDLIKFKERALITHVAQIFPKFMLHTPGMKRAAKAIEEALYRVQSGHTPAQRVNAPRDLADDLLSLHASNPQFLPESNMGFSLSAPMLASMYLGDALGFALYAMASQPGLYERIAVEGEALFDGRDPKEEDFTTSSVDVTRRFIMECMRMYPIIPMSIRNVMNSCVVEGHELPVGAKIFIAQTASHYMPDVFPDPFAFDIDRYQPPRNEHRSSGYAPYGWGTHTCLGFRWMELLLTINLLMIAYYFKLELHPSNYRIKFNPFPSMSPSKKLKFLVAEQRHELSD